MDDYEEQQKQEAFEEGFEDGANAGFWDEVFHGIGDTLTIIVPESDEHAAHEAGYHKGLQKR